LKEVVNVLQRNFGVFRMSFIERLLKQCPILGKSLREGSMRSRMISNIRKSNAHNN